MNWKKIDVTMCRLRDTVQAKLSSKIKYAQNIKTRKKGNIFTIYIYLASAGKLKKK